MHDLQTLHASRNNHGYYVAAGFAAGVHDNLRNPAVTLGIPGGIFRQTERHSPPVNSSPDVCERATLESGLTLEDPRLGAPIDRRPPRVCLHTRVHARTRTPGACVTDAATRTCLWKAAGMLRMPDDRRVIISCVLSLFSLSMPRKFEL